MISVLLVDDHRLIRAGLRGILDQHRDISVVAEAGTGEQALQLLNRLRPNVVLMDLSMPGRGGLETTRRIVRQYPDIGVIALSVHSDELYPARVLEAGAMGYLTKDCEPEEIIKAVQRVHSGELHIESRIARNLAMARLDGRDTALDELSEREAQVMQMVTCGHSIQSIADQLCLSPKTVNTYRYRLFQKLGVNNDVELTRLAMRHGILDEGAPGGPDGAGK